MDAVITYVDGSDPLWQEDYCKKVNVPVMNKRYRDWGTLKYLLRGIEVFLPFVNNVYLLVSRDSQVPQWVDRSNLKIVTHDMIMPVESLPTFNSSMIEMFIHKIPGLSERFLYFNDDMFPIRPCDEEIFFPGGRPRIGFTPSLFSFIDFKKLCRHSDALAKKALGRCTRSPFFVRPQHTCSPMLKSVCEEVYVKVEDDIMASLTPLRGLSNYNQYLFLDYMYYTRIAVPKRLPAKYFSLGFTEPEQIVAKIEKPGDKRLICINDAHIDEEKFLRAKEVLTAAFERLLPGKSRFEK